MKRQTIDWFATHMSWVVSGAVGIIAALFLAGRFLGLFQGNSQVDFVAAQIAYHRWDVQKLEKLIQRHPELHAKYDAPMAQKLLSSSESGLANSYASATIKRLGNTSPYYTEFAQSTLLIAEGRLKEALEGAKQLKLKLDKDQLFWSSRGQAIRHGSLLYAYNLLRIAMLEKAAGCPQGELMAWQEFKKNAGEPSSEKYDPEAYLLLQRNFQKQNISLLDYIRYREHSLTSTSSSPAASYSDRQIGP